MEGDVQAVGEIARALTFPAQPEEMGCYGSFRVRPDATPSPVDSIERVFRLWTSNQDANDPMVQEYLNQLRRISKAYSFSESGVKIDCLWYWDGDGTLVYTFRTLDGRQRIIENSDCKKDYCWRELDSG